MANLVGALSQCDRPIQERMVWHFFMVEDELGQRIGEGLGISADDVRHLPAAADPDADRGRGRSALANLGKNGPRDVSGMTMTHCVAERARGHLALISRASDRAAYGEFQPPRPWWAGRLPFPTARWAWTCRGRGREEVHDLSREVERHDCC